MKPNEVLFKHALRAAIVPVITIFGLDFACLLSGTIFTEQIFGIDGIGHWGLPALSTPIDLNVVSATVLVGAVLVVVANLLVDIIYGFLRPPRLGRLTETRRDPRPEAHQRSRFSMPR